MNLFKKTSLFTRIFLTLLALFASTPKEAAHPFISSSVDHDYE